MAFLKLAMSRRYSDFTITELIEAAGIGKSTFYEHYRSKDDLLYALMDGMLMELAAAANGALDPQQLRGLLAHFWDNRRLGKAVFGPQLGPPVRRRLEELIEQQFRGNRARASFAAAGQIGLLHGWLSGELSVNLDDVATALTSSR
jgi:AcrR family transcriptional regulator